MYVLLPDFSNSRDKSSGNKIIVTLEFHHIAQKSLCLQARAIILKILNMEENTLLQKLACKDNCRKTPEFGISGQNLSGAKNEEWQLALS